MNRFSDTEPEPPVDYDRMTIEEGNYTLSGPDGDTESGHGWGLWIDGNLLGYYDSERRATYAGNAFLAKVYNR